MAQGMEQVIDPQQTDFFFSLDGIRLPCSEADYDRYCYYVAGTVGHMITELAITHYGLQGALAERLLINSEASGRALQKTNIIKDFAKDLQRRACFLPDEWLQEVNRTPLSLGGAPAAWKEKVLVNVLIEYENSVNYVLDLPQSALGFRKASLLMMLPGYQTLLQAARNHERLFTPAHNTKISRRTMAKCLFDARMIVNNDEAILSYSRKAGAELSKALDSAKIAATN
jgi:farnesyl-diphosphate farnesyltransferase